MKYLFVKMRRDIIKLWPQFVSVFLMSVLSVTIYSGMEGVWHGMNIVVDKYYEDTNLADAWVYGADITENMMKEISALADVKQASYSMTANVNAISGQEDKPDIKLIGGDDVSLAAPLTIEGKEFDVNSSGLWVDSDFAKERNLQVGDALVLNFNGKEKEFIIEGLIINSEFIYFTGSATETIPNHRLHGYGFINEKTARDIYGKVSYNEVRLKINSNSDMTLLSKQLQTILGDSYYGFSERDDVSAVSQIKKETFQMKNMAQMFSAVFILLAVLTMITTMSRLVNNQMIQVGTMKALGYKDWQIRVHYGLYGFFVSLTGGVLGRFIGPLLVSKAIMKVKKTTLTLPEWKIEISYVTYLILAAIVLICTAAAVIAAQRGLHGMPAETMRGMAPKVGSKSTLENHKRFWRIFSIDWRWTFRDISRSKIRTLMGIIGVTGSMMLMIAGLGFKNSIDYSNDYVYSKQYKYSIKAQMGRTSNEGKRQLEELAGEHQWMEEKGVELYFGALKKTGVISILEEGNFVNLENLKGESIKLPEEGVVITRKVAKSLGAHIGDTISFRVAGNKQYLKAIIKDIAFAPSPQGLFLSKYYWEEGLRQTFSSSAVLIGDEKAYDKLTKLQYVKDVITKDKQIKNMDKMAKSVMTIIYLMIAASVILSIVILYNLGMLNFVERTREYATMKVLGFYQSEIIRIALRDCFVTTSIGWLSGIPIGLKFLKTYIGVVSFNSFEWVAEISVLNLTIASVIVIGCSVSVSLLLGYRVKKINMAEALKSVE